MNILITGANGFIGRAVYRALATQNHRLTCVFRTKNRGVVEQDFAAATLFFVEDSDQHTDWGPALEGVAVIVHLAALVHLKPKKGDARHQRFLAVNYEGTRNLAVQAARKGVSRFVFISSIGVNGSVTPGKPFDEEDVEHPHNSYAIAKLEAEKALRQIEAETAMEVVILRPPLVYGPGVRANFLKLLTLVHTPIPLPFGGITNKRSFMALENLVDAIGVCIRHENARGKTFLVSDSHDVSTRELVQKISKAMGRQPALFSVPDKWAGLFFRFLGKQRLYEQLWGDLRVDSAKIHRELGWVPRVSVDHAIRRTVDWYLTTESK